MQKHSSSYQPYIKFALMLTVSFVIMYGVMFLNVAELNHIYLSNTRLYMTLLMVSPMAILKLFFMSDMYKDKKLNIGIVFLSVYIFITALLFLRTQTFISDEQYMKAMIPHHSSAILVSENATFKNSEVKELSVEIIKAQEKEIAEMKKLLEVVE
ncbi:DUF305 domain-containing protein [Bernardetia sp. Wsw4-3y2]|uniref:DUF305 domain-containing protein n=1 Tax=Bernardetia sp. Wsw4-3y2 TaxID=3127471 RepID=UPI0030D01E16